MLPVNVEESHICVGDRFSVFFLRTLRVPEDGRTYPLPPGLGEFPIHWVEDYTGSVPPDWLVKGGVFIPLYQREALWLGFEAARWKPNAVKVGVGGSSALHSHGWMVSIPIMVSSVSSSLPRWGWVTQSSLNLPAARLAGSGC